MDKSWYVVYTNPQFEEKVAGVLAKKNFENYCPMNMVRSHRHDHRKITFTPLFSSYIFVRACENQQTELGKVKGIINFVYWLRKPAVISNAEIDSIKKFLNDYGNVHLERVDVSVNDIARMVSGPKMNQEGNIISTSNQLVKVALPSLGYLMVAHVEKQNVKVIISKTSNNYATSR
jgi:transcription antitermination factor NusG